MAHVVPQNIKSLQPIDVATPFQQKNSAKSGKCYLFLGRMAIYPWQPYMAIDSPLTLSNHCQLVEKYKGVFFRRRCHE
jgi:hypothetical protein